ncbi:MAG TPA: TetR family transcriptional regulator [Dongiaceae bacterium]|nr:TetR family transcriptional regulator [Dongiaceae bacterium]
MVKKTKEEALETRNTLLDTAEQVFYRKGVSQTTLNDIAQAAGMTRGAIYWHFKNKVDLFNAMCDRVTLPLETMTEAATRDDVADPLGELRHSVRYFFEKVVTDQHYRLVFDILFNKCEFVAELGPIMDRDARVRAEFRQRFERMLANAEKRGQIPRGLNHRLTAESYQAYAKGILRSWLLDPNSFDLLADGDRMLDAFFELLQVSKALRSS